jgi:hypothetical protein
VLLQVFIPPRSVKTVNERVFYCLLLGETISTRCTPLFVLPARAGFPHSHLPTTSNPPSLFTHQVRPTSSWRKDHLPPCLADSHSGAGAGSALPHSVLQWVVGLEHPLSPLFLCWSRWWRRNGANHARHSVQIRPGPDERKNKEDHCEADEGNWSDHRGIHWV